MQQLQLQFFAQTAQNDSTDVVSMEVDSASADTVVAELPVANEPTIEVAETAADIEETREVFKFSPNGKEILYRGWCCVHGISIDLFDTWTSFEY